LNIAAVVLVSASQLTNRRNQRSYVVRPRQLSDAQILRAAREAFLRDGPGVSTDAIAEALGISAAAIFKRFRSKKRLMLEALIPQRPRWFDLVERGPTARPLRAQLLELGREVLDFYRRQIPCVSVLRSSGMDLAEFFAGKDPPPPLEGARLLGQWFERAKGDGRIRDDADGLTCASAFLGALHMHVFLDHLTRRTDALQPAEDHLRHLVDTVLQGARGGRA
jgi:AcrR family transcriptional regulator